MTITKVGPTFEVDSLGPCPGCGTALPVVQEVCAAYFLAGGFACGKCARDVDPWGVAVERIKELPFRDIWLYCLGARISIAPVKMKLNGRTLVDLSQYGVPEGATILSAFAQRTTRCEPIECVDRQLLRDPKLLLFFGAAVGEPDPPYEDVHVIVNWIHPEDATEDRIYLVDAFEAAARGRFPHMLVPAFTAVEIGAIRVVVPLLESRSSKKKVKEVRRDSLKAAAVLNVLLPALGAPHGLRPMPPPLLAKLNELRGLRNDFVHEGLPAGTITEQVAGELLAASVFGVEYMKYARGVLVPGTTTW